MSEQSKAVFKVVIKGTIDQVWRELTKTDEVQAAMFNSRLHTPGLQPGSPILHALSERAAAARTAC